VCIFIEFASVFYLAVFKYRKRGTYIDIEALTPMYDCGVVFVEEFPYFRVRHSLRSKNKHLVYEHKIVSCVAVCLLTHNYFSLGTKYTEAAVSPARTRISMVFDKVVSSLIPKGTSTYKIADVMNAVTAFAYVNILFHSTLS